MNRSKPEGNGSEEPTNELRLRWVGRNNVNQGQALEEMTIVELLRGTM